MSALRRIFASNLTSRCTVLPTVSRATLLSTSQHVMKKNSMNTQQPIHQFNQLNTRPITTSAISSFSSSTAAATGAATGSAGSLHGRVALVTGSTSGIGLGIARVFAQNGADLVLNGFGDAKEIEALVHSLHKQYGVRVIYSSADMSKPEQIRAMVKEATDKLGGVDILVNNAGIQHVAPVESFPADKWDAIISINLSAAFHAIQAALPHMQSKGWGRIINIASAHGKVASTGKSAYVASKHGIVGLTKVVALENANKGITANAICPGWVLTPLVQKQIDDRAKAKGISAQQEKDSLLGEKQPMLEFSSPESLGGLAAFLAGPYSNTITGTTISMDGGWTAQ